MRYRMEVMEDRAQARSPDRVLYEVVDTERRAKLAAFTQHYVVANGLIKEDAQLILEALHAWNESGSQKRAA